MCKNRAMRGDTRAKKTFSCNRRKYFIILSNVALSILIIIPTFLAFLYGLVRVKKAFPSTILFSLTKNQILQKSRIEDLFVFLNEERFQKYFSAENLLIEVRGIRARRAGNVTLTNDVPTFLLSKCLKRTHYPALLKEVFGAILDLRHQNILNLREIKILVLDAPLYKMIHKLCCRDIYLVTTNSSLRNLPYAFQSSLRGKKYMLWYSTNSKPFVLRGQKQDIGLDLDAVSRIVDLHLVWTRYDVNFLKSLGISNAQQIGSILLQKKIFAEQRPQRFCITYFDVTPLASKMNWLSGVEENFYSEANALKDLKAIERLATFLTDEYGSIVELRIKPKRPYGSQHSKEYITKLKMNSKSQNFKILDCNSNLYKVVSESDLVVATPWSSPAVLAKELHVNSLYFAIRGKEWNLPSRYEGLRVVTSVDELIKYVSGKTKKKLDLKDKVYNS